MARRLRPPSHRLSNDEDTTQAVHDNLVAAPPQYGGEAQHNLCDAVQLPQDGSGVGRGGCSQALHERDRDEAGVAGVMLGNAIELPRVWRRANVTLPGGDKALDAGQRSDADRRAAGRKGRQALPTLAGGSLALFYATPRGRVHSRLSRECWVAFSMCQICRRHFPCLGFQSNELIRSYSVGLVLFAPKNEKEASQTLPWICCKLLL